MATAPLFGTPGGFRQYDLDQAELSRLAAQTALTRAQVPHQQALTELNREQAATMRAKREEDAEIRRILAETEAQARGAPADFVGPLEPGQEHERPLSPPERMSQLGQSQMRAAGKLAARGYVDAGKKMMDSGRQLVEGASRIGANESLADLREMRAAATAAQRFGEIFAGVTSQAGYNNAIMTWVNDPVLRNQPLPRGVQGGYNPRELQEAVQASKAAVDLFNARIRAADLARKDKLRVETEAEGESRRNYRAGILELYGAREDRIRAAGGGSVPQPNQEDYRAARKVLKDMGYEFDPDGEVQTVYGIVQRAAKLFKENKALGSRADALAEAVRQARAAGELPEPGTPARVLGLPVPGTRGTDRPFRPNAVPRSTPSPPKPPPGMQIAPQDIKDYKPGVTYWDPDTGDIGTYDPKAPGGFRNARQGPKAKQRLSALPAPIPSSRLLADSEDDEDDEEVS